MEDLRVERIDTNNDNNGTEHVERRGFARSTWSHTLAAARFVIGRMTETPEQSAARLLEKRRHPDWVIRVDARDWPVMESTGLTIEETYAALDLMAAAMDEAMAEARQEPTAPVLPSTML